MPEAANQGEHDLDIVVVTYNSAAHIEGALRDLPPVASLVVVDNASDDDSADRARRCGAEVVESPVNAGFAASANRGARLGRGDFILFLNPDATIGPEAIAHLVDALRDDHGLGIVGPRLRSPDHAPQQPAWPFPSVWTSWREAFGVHRLTPSTIAEVFVIGAALLIRRSAFDQLTGFDERFWLYAEESDLCRRALDAGWRIQVVEEAVATHVGGASGAADPDIVFEHFNRGLEHYIDKRHGASGLVSLRASLAAGSAIRAVAPGSPDRRAYHRRRLRRLWSVTRSHPWSVPLESPATRAPGIGTVVCSLEPWDDVWRRNQFLIRELLRREPNRRFLVVEPPFDRLHEVRRRAGRIRRGGLRPLDEDGRVVLVEPGKLWPRFLGPLADRSLRRQVLAATGSLGFDDPTLWLNDPSYAGVVATTRWSSLYDITDDWAEADGPPRLTERVVDLERTLFAECGSVVVCSPGLASSRRDLRPDLALIPNAVDVEHFQRPRDRPVDLPATPTAVYVGTLHLDRIDIDLVERLAVSVSELTVVLVGPNSLPQAVTERLAAHPNISILGSRPYADVPGYLQHADVVVVPHVVSSFTESLDPIKAYECLAVGRPTVATPVAGFRDLGAPVVIADGPAFVESVGRLAREVHVSTPRPVPTWTDRAEAFDHELAAARIATSRKLRVVYLDHCAQLSGAELALARVIPALDDVEAHVILGEHGPLEARLRSAGATVEVLALDPSVATTRRDEARLTSVGARRLAATMTDTIALARRLRQVRPDLVETNSLKAAVYGGVAGRLAGVPVVWHIHDRIASDYLPTPAVRVVRALARVLPRSVIANSEATRATLTTRRDVVVVPNVLDPDASPRPRACADSGLIRFAMVGRLAPWKGQDVFLEAFAKAFPEGLEQAEIVGSAMFGEDGYAQDLVARIEELGLTDRVTLVGFTDDVPSVLARVDCLVHASVTPEPFGQVIVEGMAAGLPVIASDAGGPAEIIADGMDGLLHRPGDVDQLSHLLVRVAQDPELRADLSRRALVRAQSFTGSVVGPTLMAVYRDALDGHRRFGRTR